MLNGMIIPIARANVRGVLFYQGENNSFGDMSMGKWYGNVRLKSRYRNIDLAAVGDESYVNIFTQGATIQVDATGNITLLFACNRAVEVEDKVGHKLQASATKFLVILFP